MIIQSLWHLSSSTSEWQSHPHSPQEGELLIKSHYSLVSLGTERLVALGQVPDDLKDLMPVPYMEGHFDFPIKYGYSLVGEVLTADHPLTGKMVHLLHPHQDHCFVKAESVAEIPADIPPLRVTLTSNLETAVNAIWDSSLSAGDRVVVIGFGLIGSLVARVASFFPAVEVVIVEKDEDRIRSAQEMGFEVIPAEQLKADFDLAFNCSSAAAGLQVAIDQVGMEGQIVEMSWYGTQKVDLQLGAAFHYRRQKLISSQVSHLPADRIARWDYRRRKEIVLKLLRNPVFDLHITDIVPFNKVPAFFQKLRQREITGLSYTIQYIN